MMMNTNYQHQTLNQNQNQNQNPQAQFRAVFNQQQRNNNPSISVSLFINNGRMDTAYAVPFTINPNWDINQCKQECCYKLYNRPLNYARIFTEMGVEILSPEYIAPLQSLVVSQGENFVPTTGRLPGADHGTMGLQLDNFLTDIYSQNLPPHPRATDTVKRKLEEWETIGREYMLGKKAKLGQLPPSVGGDNANYMTRMMEKMPDELAANGDRTVEPQLKRLFDNLQGGIPHIDLSMQMLPNTPSLFPEVSIKNQMNTNSNQFGQISLQDPTRSNSIGSLASDKRGLSKNPSQFTQSGEVLPAGYEYGSPVYHSPFNNTPDHGLNSSSNLQQSHSSTSFLHAASQTRVSVDDNHPLTHQRPSLSEDGSVPKSLANRYPNASVSGPMNSGDMQAVLGQQSSPAPSVGGGGGGGGSSGMAVPRVEALSHPRLRGQGSQTSLDATALSRDSSMTDLKASISPLGTGSPSVPKPQGDTETLEEKATKSAKKLSKTLNIKTNTKAEGGSGKEEQYRTESHKASEQRSRTRLKDSINELATTVPTLVNVKNPSKAHIIKKATEFVHDTQKTNTELRLEHEKLKSELAALHLKHMKSMNTMNMGNIITVEILSKDFNYIFVDHMWEVFLGYSRAEVLGKTFKDITSCRNCDLMKRRSLEIQETMHKKQVWRGLILSKRKDGQAFCCDTTMTPVLDESGEIMQFVINRKKFHILNGVDCQNICRGIMPEPKLTDDAEPKAEQMIEEAILETQQA